MDYVIKNHKNVYIRLNKNGTAITCTEHEKGLFEYSKAKNIQTTLPKPLKKLNFEVAAIADIVPQTEGIEKKVIITENYIVPEGISYWVEKFGICDDILKEAKKRKDELNKALSNVEKEFVNLMHELEFEGKIDLYGGWQERNKIKENRERRRVIKDELLIVSNVLKMDFRNLDRDIVNKAVTGLAKRKFTYRIIDEEQEVES